MRLRAHAAASPLAAQASLWLAALLVWAKAEAIAPPLLVAWLGALAVAVVLRAWLPHAHRRAVPSAVSPAGAAPGVSGLQGAAPALATRRRLWQYRLLILGHGVVWGAVAWLPVSLHDAQLQTSLVILLVGLAVGAMMLTLFDLPAALLFVAAVLLPLAARLGALAGPLPTATAVAGAMAMLLLGILALAGRRADRERHALARVLRAERHSAGAAREAQALLNEAFQHAGQGISVFDRDLRLRAWNPQLFATTGLNPAAVSVGMPLRDWVAGLALPGGFEGAGAGFELDRQVQAMSDPRPVVTQVQRADGRRIETRRNPLPGGGVVVFHADITERERARSKAAEQQRKLTLLLEITEQGFWYIDNQLCTTDANPAMCRMLGIERAQLIGRSIYDFVDAANRAVFEQHLRVRSEGHADSYEIVLTRTDGRLVHCFNNGTPVFDTAGRKTGALGLFSDISAQKQAELQAEHAGAEAELARAEADRAREEAESANRAKSEFLSRMSHELRTPLNAILGFGQLLQADAVDPLSVGQRQHVDELLRGGRHLLELINDVLDVACIEAGHLQLTLQPVNLAALALDCLRLMQPVAMARGVSMVLQFEPPDAAWRVTADATRLKQVLLNLLSNAIKFNRAAGEVRVRGLVVANGVLLEVADQGRGIPADQLPRLFQAFERLDMEGAVEGTGIGLALSRSLVTLMHGEIGVRSGPGPGSVFWLRLPASTAGIITASLPVVAGTPAHGQRRHDVLYIEDNAVNQLLMQGMLGHRPAIDLRLAAWPEDGLAMAIEQPPDLLLLDIQLPGMDGFELLRRLRQQPTLRHIPVIAVSANAMPDDLADAQRAGFADYLTKPVDLRRLLALVDQALSA